VVEIPFRIAEAVAAHVRLAAGLVRVRPPVGAEAEVVVLVAAGRDALLVHHRERPDRERFLRLGQQALVRGSDRVISRLQAPAGKVQFPGIEEQKPHRATSHAYLSSGTSTHFCSRQLFMPSSASWTPLAPSIRVQRKGSSRATWRR